ncbi:MAG TPA: hypothetical protein VL134_08360 [Leptolyngbya sp.]|jgi:hypothetical protein|nr:hypothetical protein [Leptolyngbya sp.]
MTQLLSKTLDRHLVLQGTWEHFKHIQKGFEATPGAKLSYYNGTIEIFMPGENHEYFSRVINFLVSTFLIKQGIWFRMTGAVTQEQEGESFCSG